MCFEIFDQTGSGRVILLSRGDVELPSDTAGLIHIDIGNGVKAAGEDIRREAREIIDELSDAATITVHLKS